VGVNFTGSGTVKDPSEARIRAASPEYYECGAWPWKSLKFCGMCTFAIFVL